MRTASRLRRLLAAALATAAVATAAALPAGASQVPAGYAYSDAWFASFDGTQLHAGVFLPSDREAGERHPVLMVITPYTAPGAGGATSEGPTIRFPELFDHAAFREGRWAYVQVDARGFGGSEGCFGYYMPHEAADAKVAVEWAADQAWSTGKVGMWGKSYDSAQQVLALASRPRGLAGTVIQAPGLSGYTALWHNGVHYATGRYATTGVYTADDLTPPQNRTYLADTNYARAAAAPATSVATQPTCRFDAAAMNAIGDRADPYWEDKEPYREAAGADVPTFWSHGFWDANTKPVHLDVWSSLTGPKQAWFGQYTHLRGHEGGVGREGFLDEAFRFLDRHVRGVDSPVSDPAVTVQQGNDGVWRAEEQWPPADGRPWTMPLNAGTYTDEPGNSGYGPSEGEGVWSVGPELPHAAHLAGEVTLRVRRTTTAPGTHLVAHLYDVDDSGYARLVSRGAFADENTGDAEATVTLYPQDWVFEPGHRVAVRLSASDDAWYSPGLSGTSVQVTGGEMTLPLLRYLRTGFLEGDASDGMSGAPLRVSAQTLEAASVDVEPPPPQEPRPQQ